MKDTRSRKLRLAKKCNCKWFNDFYNEICFACGASWPQTPRTIPVDMFYKQPLWMEGKDAHDPVVVQLLELWKIEVML